MDTKEAKKEKPPVSYLHELSAIDNGEAHYYELELQYIRQFLNSVSIEKKISGEAKLAYTLCHGIENNKLGLSKLSAKFPQQKVDFHNRIQEEVQPLIECQELIEQQLKALRINKNGSQKDIANLESKKIELDKQIAKISDAKYSPKYPENGQRENKLERTWNVDPQDWKKLLELLDTELKQISHTEPGPYLKNLIKVGKDLGLTEAEIKVLTFLEVYQNSSVDQPLDVFTHFQPPKNQREVNAVIAAMVGLKIDEVSAMFRPESHLMQYGLVSATTTEVDYGSKMVTRAFVGFPFISDYLADILSEPDITPQQIKEKLTGQILSTDLDWQKDFDRLGDDGPRMERLIKATIHQREKGEKVSGPTFFFHGEPDTGKTSAVAALVKHLQKTDPDIEVRIIGERAGTEVVYNEDNNVIPGQTRELTPQDRISQINMALALGGKNPKTIFLIEEPSFLPKADHSDGIDDSVDRVIIQRLLENHGASALFFTTNHFDDIHPAVRRRAPMAIEFKTPNVDKRKALLARICESKGVTLSETDLTRLASTYKVAAGKWASAVNNAVVTAESPEVFASEIDYWIQHQAKRDLGSVDAVMSVHKKPVHSYDFKLMNLVDPTIPLDDLSNRLRKLKDKPADEQSFRICLEGWSGTGKSEFVWHLADLMGKEVVVKTAAELLGKYVGETEKNIADAFEEAKVNNAILLIDEVDSVLSSRKNANQSWEKTQVNQFLTSLDQYQGMVAVTTNHFDMIDSAAKRRFDFEMGFDFLNKEQNMYAFKKFLNMEPPETFVPPNNLTPSDYTKVMRQAKFMGREDDPKFLIDQLAAIAKKKPTEERSIVSDQSMGFRAALYRAQKPIAKVI